MDPIGAFDGLLALQTEARVLHTSQEPGEYKEGRDKHAIGRILAIAALPTWRVSKRAGCVLVRRVEALILPAKLVVARSRVGRVIAARIPGIFPVAPWIRACCTGRNVGWSDAFAAVPAETGTIVERFLARIFEQVVCRDDQLEFFLGLRFRLGLGFCFGVRGDVADETIRMQCAHEIVVARFDLGRSDNARAKVENVIRRWVVQMRGKRILILLRFGPRCRCRCQGGCRRGCGRRVTLCARWS